MTKTPQIALRNVSLVGGKQPIVFPRATLLLHQEYISDGLGGHLPGMRSWEIRVASGMPFTVLLDGDNFTFEAAPYSGKCFATNNTTLQGTGPITGLP